MTAFSYQLYSSRNFPPLRDTMRMVAKLGYAHVEGYGALFSDASQIEMIADSLTESGLTMPTAHFGLDMVAQAPDQVLDAAARLGVQHIFCPHLAEEERPSDAAGWSAFGQKLAAAGQPIWDAGLGFGWHNHDFEFAAVEGQMPFDLIFAADDRLVAELDLAWIARAGQDPHQWLDLYGPRTAAVHVKDIAAPGTAEDEDGWADVGHGTLDWARLYHQAKAHGCRHFIMEHDNPSDHHRFADRSLTAARAF